MLTSTGVAIAAAFILLTLCYNSYISSAIQSSDTLSGDEAQTIPAVACWTPWLWHALSSLHDPERFIRRIRQHSIHGLFSIRLRGRMWNVITNRALLEQLDQQPEGVLDVASAEWSFLCAVFDADPRYKHAFLESRKELHLSSTTDPTLLCALARRIESQLPHLISFSESVVDQTPWERSGKAEFIHDAAVDVDLHSLTRAFVGHSTLPSLLGSEFLDVYPGVLDDLHDLDDSLKYLLVGLPRWFPVPSLAKANIARHRLDNAIDSFHEALDKSAIEDKVDLPWRDLSDVSRDIKARSAIWRKFELPPGVKGPCNLHLLWAMNTKIHSLVFWLLLRIRSEPGLVERIRFECGSFVKVDSSQRFSVPEPPRLQMNLGSLSQFCPLLKSCFRECLRLDTSPFSFRSILQNVVITKPREDLFGAEQPASFRLKAGEMLVIPWRLHHYGPIDSKFRAERFLVPDPTERERISIDPRSSEQWGEDESVFPGRAFIENVVLALVVGILALWDLELLESGRHAVPLHKNSPNFLSPMNDVRVRVRRRAV